MRSINFLRVSWSTTPQMRRRLFLAQAAHERLTGKHIKFSQFLSVVVDVGLKALAGEEYTAQTEEGEKSDGRV